MSDMKGEWGSIWWRRIYSELPFWFVVEHCESEEQGNARAAELQAADPTHEYKAEKFLEPPPTAQRRILPDMTVGQLIAELERYNPQLKVVLTQSGMEAQGVKVCYVYGVKKSNDYGDFELVPEWQIKKSVGLETEQAVVLGKDMKFI